jgi:POT family proton-dependent oligopeptide transporter
MGAAQEAHARRSGTGQLVLMAEDRARDLFGHPRGLTYLFTVEMWERFSYYGMRALLVLYMVKHLFQPGHAETVIGFAALRSVFEAVFGPLGVQPLASHVYGLYTGLVYLTPVFGGLIADRWLGQRRTVVLGAALMALGHFLMAFESLFLIALFVLIIGNGAFKPNISTQVGTLYAPGDPRRDRAFSIFYVGINLGAFLAPLVSGTLGEHYGWHYGFTAAGVGMTLGLVIYLLAAPSLPPDVHTVESAAEKRPLNRDEWRAIVALCVLFVPVSFFWATYEQAGNTIALWADSYADRSVFGLFTIPVTWFQAFNPFMIFALTPLIIALWARQAMGNREPSSVMKMAYGCFYVAAANLVMVAASALAGSGTASWLWLFAYFVVLTIGELYLSPTSLSLVTKVAPARVVSLMMGVWLATSFAGGLLAGYLGSFWSGMGKSDFFMMIAIIAALAGVAILAVARPVTGMLKH